ncbi:MAG: trypsin-like peptidase domain-containing protein [Candidatus Bathyarchaeota archaeon]|nr:trypsin-like peptidase domain-containing protein [Candidatus Bathyarchaeota archaeon]
MPSSRKNLLLVSVLVIQLILLGAFAYLYSDTKSQYDVVRREYDEINSQLQELRQRPIVVTGNDSIIPSLIYESIEPSVVKITNRGESFFIGEYHSEGSGFVYDKKGHIITNNHVVEGADSIEVTFLDGEIYKAEIIGTDAYSDIGVVKIDIPPDRLKPVFLGDSSEIQIGERVYAIGTPFGLSGSMTEGIVSQLGRTLPAVGGYLTPSVIQVDAAINPGNSGGPLLNIYGEVIGVNTAIQSETGVFSGVGFAIPSNLVKKVASSLILSGEHKHAWIGISGMSLNIQLEEIMGLNNTKGFLIQEVTVDSPAERGGLRGGEEIVTIDDQEVKIGGDVVIAADDISIIRLEDLLVYLEYEKSPGDEIVLKIIRDGELIEVKVLLGERPSPEEIS